MVAAELQRIGARTILLDQRQFKESELAFNLDRSGIVGRIRVNGSLHRLEDITTAYLRLLDKHAVPGLSQQLDDSPDVTKWRELHDQLWQWSEVATAHIVNRPSAMASNCSKPYQAQLLRTIGWRVPETLVTNNCDLVRAFLSQHGRVIYKSCSDVRSIVQELDDPALDRLTDIEWCPVQFQEFVVGVNIRVHVIGSTAIATLIRTSAIDYRYPAPSHRRTLEPFELDRKTTRLCIDTARLLNLGFAGIDLKMDENGTLFCLEVNPCPGFSFFQRQTGQPIATALAHYLRRASLGQEPPSDAWESGGQILANGAAAICDAGAVR